MKRRTLTVAAASSAIILLSSATLHAQLPAGDLRLWLRADSLQLGEDAQVTSWVDQSSHGTVFAPRTTRWDGTPVEEFPHLQTMTVNGGSFPTVKFERNGALPSGDPAVDRSGNTDRLYQTTNLTPGSDPLVIADGTTMTSFTVFRPIATGPNSPLGTQAVWGKRGNDASLMELGIQPTGRLLHVSYDANVAYQTQATIPAQKWNIIEYALTEQAPNDAVTFRTNSTEDASAPLVDLPVATNGGVIADRNDGINEDPAGSVEPFGIGGHAQDCCGEGETFAGNIAEIIIYAGELSAADKNQIYAYLANKYLAAVPEPVTMGMGVFGLIGVIAMRRRCA